MISECLKSQDKKYIYIYLNEKEKNEKHIMFINSTTKYFHVTALFNITLN